MNLYKLIFFIIMVSFSYQVKAQDTHLIIGTYTNKGNSEGIYVYNFNESSAETKLKSIAKNIINPSYLTISAGGKQLYSVSENRENSALSAFQFNPSTAELSLISQQPAAGADPCYIINNQHHVISANYSSGSISVFGREATGALTDLKQVVQHHGKSIDPKRQASAHVHQVVFSPDEKYLLANDLGEDQIYIYAYHANSTDQVLTLKKTIKTAAGSGPRHLTFSPNGKFIYLTYEFTGLVSVFAYAAGDLIKVQDIATVAPGFSGKIDGADIHVSPDGKFVYQTNRGDANNISTFSVKADGTLKRIDQISTLGKGPRNFAIDPKGNFLLVAHQTSNEVVIFKRNQKNGLLKDTGRRIQIGAPVCLVFSK